MPYSKNEELPKGVKNNLPAHAQDIYREAFNHAWEQYTSPELRLGSATHEETTHKVAWAAVEKKYHKDKNGKWVEK